jgi:hypothetical protein
MSFIFYAAWVEWRRRRDGSLGRYSVARMKKRSTTAR